MTFFRFLVTYWTQLTILIFAIGYVIKIILDFNIKKREIKFNFIHKERAEIIKQLHFDIIELSKEIQKMALAHQLTLMNQGPTNQQRKEVFGAITVLNKNIFETIEKNRIYFSDSFFSQLNTLVENVRDNIIMTSLDRNVILKDESKEYIFSDSATFLKYYEDEFPKIQVRLRNEFRRYL